MKPTRTFLKASPEPWDAIADQMADRIQDDLLMDAAEEARKSVMDAYHQRQVWELKGAWRAGYSFLDVLQPTQPELHTLDDWEAADHTAQFAIQVAFIPHDGGFTPPAGYLGQRFHLDGVTREDVDALDAAVADRGEA